MRIGVGGTGDALSSRSLRDPSALDAGAVGATDNEPAAALEFSEVTVEFGAAAKGTLRKALGPVSFTVPARTFVSVVGPSGCGKSTLLNLASDLLAPSAGHVYRRGELVTSIDPRVAYVTQESTLLPWMKVLDNVALPLQLAGVTRREREQRAREWLQRVGLGECEKLYPGQLSGGMQKRCSIARAFVAEPEILLMDEPFSSLDAITRATIHEALLKLCEVLEPAVLFVTHDISEAIVLSDRIVVMTTGPGTVRAVLPVNIPRPRHVVEEMNRAETTTMARGIWSLLAGAPSDGGATGAGTPPGATGREER